MSRLSDKLLFIMSDIENVGPYYRSRSSTRFDLGFRFMSKHSNVSCDGLVFNPLTPFNDCQLELNVDSIESLHSTAAPGL